MPAPLHHAVSEDPEPGQRGGHARTRLHLSGVDRPGDRRAEVVQFPVESVEPSLLVRSPEVSGHALGEIGEEHGVPPPDLRLLTRGRQQLAGKVADGFEHGHPQPSRHCVVAPQQTLVVQGGDNVHEVDARRLLHAHRLDRLERAPARED